LGDGTAAAYKKLIKIDLAGANDVSDLSGSAALASNAVSGSVFLDIAAGLTNAGFAATNIPAKLEGAAWGQDVMINGTNTHTLYIANDNDFVTNTAGPCMVFVFGVTDSDLLGSTFVNQSIASVPEPSTYALFGLGALALVIACRRRYGCVATAGSAKVA